MYHRLSGTKYQFAQSKKSLLSQEPVIFKKNSRDEMSFESITKITT